MVYDGGTITMLQDALIKCLEGKTSFEEVYRTIEIENEDDDNYENEMASEIKESVPVEEEVVTESDGLLDVSKKKDDENDVSKLVNAPAFTAADFADAPEAAEENKKFEVKEEKTEEKEEVKPQDDENKEEQQPTIEPIMVEQPKIEPVPTPAPAAQTPLQTIPALETDVPNTTPAVTPTPNPAPQQPSIQNVARPMPTIAPVARVDQPMIPQIVANNVPLQQTAVMAADLTTSFRNSWIDLSSEMASLTCSGVNMFCIVSTAMADATSPAFAPPIPSATTKSTPYSPRSVYSLVWGIIQFEAIRSLHTTKLSSLFCLIRPTFVPAANLNFMSDIFSY